MLSLGCTIRQNGEPITLRKTERVYSAATGTTSDTTTEFPVTGIFATLKDIERGNVIGTGNQAILVPYFGEEISNQSGVEWVVVLPDSRRLVVLDLVEHRLRGTIIAYELHLQ